MEINLAWMIMHVTIDHNYGRVGIGVSEENESAESSGFETESKKCR